MLMINFVFTIVVSFHYYSVSISTGQTSVIFIESISPICQFTSVIILHVFESTLFIYIGDIFCAGVRLESIYIFINIRSIEVV
jgi:hypothetical protein